MMNMGVGQNNSAEAQLEPMHLNQQHLMNDGLLESINQRTHDEQIMMRNGQGMTQMTNASQ